MPAKKSKSGTLLELLKEDASKKKLLKKEFPKFAAQLEKVIKAHPEIKELRELQVPLEKIEAIVGENFHGFDFCSAHLLEC